MTEKQCEEIGVLVVLRAEEHFRKAGCEADFCIQDIGENAIFGGTNRLRWSPDRGFEPEALFCTPKFLEYWMEKQ